ncbi:MAG: hypothetical protein COA53_06440 [Rhodobacteraceae bacterium]|nr:MAG: hypothetical protein COA53_06440 [Paracoccaceae bacterium]
MKYIGADPLTLAVTEAEFKRAVHIIDTETDDDVLIKAYLGAAIEVIETACRRLMLSRPVEFMAPAGYWTNWWFPVAPVIALDKVSYIDAAGAWADLTTADFKVITEFDEPILVVPEGFRSSVVGNKALRIQATVGYVDATYPLAMKQAVILLVKEWFEAGIAVDDAVVAKLSFGIHTLIKQRRYARPCEVA